MKKNLLKFSFVLGLAGILTSCDLESLDLTGGGGEFKTVDNAKEIVEENADTELAVVKVFENVNNYGISEEGKKSASIVDSVGPIVSWSFFPTITMTLDFTPVTNMSGKVHATINSMEYISDSAGFVPNAGLSISVAFEEYVDNGSGMDGEMVLTIESSSSAGLKYSMVTTGFLTITEEEGSYDWACDQEILWSEGFGDTDPENDSFILNGSSTQVKDTITNQTIIENLKTVSDCEYNTEGVLLITADKDGDQEFTVSINFIIGVDYEDGDDIDAIEEGVCDDWVLLNAEGIVENLKTQIGSF